MFVPSARARLRRRRITPSPRAGRLIAGAALLSLVVTGLGQAPAVAGQLTGVSVALSPTLAGQAATYTVSFTSTTGVKAGGTITLNAGTGGTVFPGGAAAYAITDTTHAARSATVSAMPALANSGGQVTITSPNKIAAGDLVKVAVAGVLNPPLAATRTLTVSTSSDTAPITSTAYAVTASADGSGTLTASPATVAPGQAATITLTYTAAPGGMAGGSVEVTVPASWTPPVLTAGAAGAVAASSGTVSVSGQTITVSTVTLPSGGTLSITYAAAVAPSTGGATTFTAVQRSTAAGTPKPLASSPTVAVGYAGDGSGSLAVSPAQLRAGTATTLTFTYTATTGGMSGGSLTLAVPAGWSAPGTSPNAPGYTTVSTGTVTTTGQTITVSGLNLPPSGTLSLRYGAQNPAVAAATIGPATFPATQRSTPTGTLTALAAPALVTLNAADDGSGTVTATPSSVDAGTPAPLTFTYAPAPGGLGNGQFVLTVPDGWTAPSSVPGDAGHVTATSGSVSTSGQQITVDGLTLGAAQPLRITYGATGGGVTGPLSSGATFSAAERSTAAGTLTPLATPVVITQALWPIAVTPPAVTGFVGVGLTLRATAPTWRNGTDTVTYQWQRCAADTTACAPIPAATGTSYVVTIADAGTSLAVTATATNTSGPGSTTSAPTSAVPAAGSCPDASATDVWTGAAGNGTWTDGRNWSKGTAPGSSDYACLPADTSPSTALAVPSTTVRRLLSFKALTLNSTIYVTDEASLQGPTTWQTSLLSTALLTIGAEASDQVVGTVQLQTTRIVNAGTVTISAGTLSFPAAIWVNSGRLRFDAPTAVTVLGGRFLNQAGGLVTTGSGGATSTLNACAFENDGTVSATSGVLLWQVVSTVYCYAPPAPAPGNDSSEGTFSTTGTADLQIGGSHTINATFTGHVWATGTITGTATVPAGSTLSLGDDPNTTVQERGATVTGTITGAGNLTATGTVVPNYGTTLTTLAADLTIARAQLGELTQLKAKPGTTATYLGPDTTVTLTAVVSALNNVAIAGTVLADAPNAGLFAPYGRIVNGRGAVITATAAATTSTFNGCAMENDGTVTATTGVLLWQTVYALTCTTPPPPSPELGNGTSEGTFSTTGTADLQIGGSHTINATFTGHVWATGTITGTATVPAGSTLSLGDDPNTTVQERGATVTGTITGAGNLTATGLNGTYPSTLAADLTIAKAQLGDFTRLQASPGTTATYLGPDTTVTLTALVTALSNVTVAGSIQVAVSNAGLSASAGRILNQSGAVITTTAATATFNACALENDGTITATTGVLLWQTVYTTSCTNPPSPGPYNGTSEGTFSTTGTADLQIGGSHTINATFTGHVWATGTITGTATVPAGSTLSLGDDPNTTVQERGATVTGTITGTGTLTATGTRVSGYGNYVTTLAADLTIARARLGDLTQLQAKPDGTTTYVGLLTTVTLDAVPSLISGVSIVNDGTIDFGSHDYFTCSTCRMLNHGNLVVTNPDGAFSHSFNITGGVFENQGLIKMTGYLPGVTVNFFPAATVIRKGLAEQDGLLQPTWIQQLQGNDVVAALANALTPGGAPVVPTVAQTPSLAAAAYLGNIGAGNCANANVSLGIAGASTGVCLVVAPDGSEGVVLSLAPSAAMPNPVTKTSWDPSQLFHGAEYNLDAGSTVMWRSGAAATQSFHLPTTDDPSNDVEGVSWCETGSLSAEVGLTGQHCWGPADGVPYDLGSVKVGLPGVHSAYVGAGPGIGAGVSFAVGYSVLITCGRWYSVTGHVCPPSNTARPVVSGASAIGSTMSASTGSWTLMDGSAGSYRYQWLRCGDTPSSCSPIPGATSSGYTVTSADRWYWMGVEVTATNSGASVSSRAVPIGPVQSP